MNAALMLIPLALLVLGLPIYLTLLTTCVLVIFLFNPVPLEVVPQVLFGSVNKVVLIALPFFILLGEIMLQGGMARRIVSSTPAPTAGSP